MRHKHADLIIEWAETGKKVQGRRPGELDWIELSRPVWYGEYEFRFKPKTIRYRLGLFSNYPEEMRVISTKSPGESKRLEQHEDFRGWLGDWQEVEV